MKLDAYSVMLSGALEKQCAQKISDQLRRHINNWLQCNNAITIILTCIHCTLSKYIVAKRAADIFTGFGHIFQPLRASRMRSRRCQAQ